MPWAVSIKLIREINLQSKVQFKSKIFQSRIDLTKWSWVRFPLQSPYVMLKLLIYTFYLQQELHSDEMFYKACVPLGDIFQ